MTQLLDTSTPLDTHRSPHELSAEQSQAAHATYERLGHHRYVRWNDLPPWQQAGYHRLALVDQIAAMQQVLQLTGAIDTQHDRLVAAVTANMTSNGWEAVSRSSSPAGGHLQDIDRDRLLEEMVRGVLHATAAHLASVVRR